jgi:hypothetical protein
VKKLRFYVFGYRDQYFWSEFGPIVRDLMMVSSLTDDDCVDSITFYNRPVSIHERVLLKKKANKLVDVSRKIKFKNANSYDLFGPFHKRCWFKDIYKKSYATPPTFDDKYTNIILDFLPIGNLPDWAFNADLYWYDLIDNFTKHNRYSLSQKRLVSDKYQGVNELGINKLITGVCASALVNFRAAHVLENAILNLPEVRKNNETETFDFGFMGFISNKFDIDAVKKISQRGYTIAIYGEVYDRLTLNALFGVPGVRLFGKFRDTDVNNILSTFNIGIIPYKNELLHDESPLKLYQYLSASKLVLSSFDFDFQHDMFYVYEAKDLEDKINLVILDLNKNKTVHEDDTYQFTWKARVDKITELICQKTTVNNT